jgi:hypothetical protein
MDGERAFATADISVRKDIRRPTPSETETIDEAMRIGVSMVDLSYFMSIPFNGQGLTTVLDRPRSTSGPHTQRAIPHRSASPPFPQGSPWRQSITMGDQPLSFMFCSDHRKHIKRGAEQQEGPRNIESIKKMR